MAPLTDIVRTEFGYYRTTCGCAACVHNCEYMPGNLVPADLFRLEQRFLEDVNNQGRTWAGWCREFLRASEGALVALGNKAYRVPTIVPATSGRPGDVSCIFLKEGKCSIHAVAPYGCAFFDCSQTQEQGDARSKAGLNAIMQDVVSEGPYFRLWKQLWAENLRTVSLQERRDLMAIAWNAKKHTGEIKKDEG